MSDVAPLRFAAGTLVDAAGEQRPWPRLALLGHPVAHSLSPRLQRAALRAADLDGDYHCVDVTGPDFAAALDAAGREGVEGLNVTLPHKEAALVACAQASEEARVIGAANTLVRRAERWHAHNTDARGLAMALQRARGRQLPRALGRVVVLGAGGAARAAVTSMRALGARRLVLLARRPERAEWARAHEVEVGVLDPEALRGATLVLQCTSAGLSAHEASPIDLHALDPTCLAFDLVYGDHETGFVRAAREKGCVTENGLPMLVAQAALAFGMWTGHDPPLGVMAESVGLSW